MSQAPTPRMDAIPAAMRVSFEPMPIADEINKTLQWE
jgi:hypothetical protein